MKRFFPLLHSEEPWTVRRFSIDVYSANSNEGAPCGLPYQYLVSNKCFHSKPCIKLIKLCFVKINMQKLKRRHSNTA